MTQFLRGLRRSTSPNLDHLVLIHVEDSYRRTMNWLTSRAKLFKEPQRLKEHGYYSVFREIESEQGTEVTYKGNNYLMFGSNSYLGLTTHPYVKESAAKALEKYGTGCGGSRLLNGTIDLHVELENRLAKFLRKDSAIVFSTGFQVNVGVIPTITGRNDFILSDRNNHASIIEGTRLSMAKSLYFKHNDMESLEKKLQFCGKDSNKLIIVDGVFSMEGDIANLPEIVRLGKEYGAVIMSDCAHAVGVIGEGGRGTASHFGLSDQVHLIGGTFSKSLASIGGFVAGDAETISFIKHQARSFIFSASMAPASVGAVIGALDVLESDDSLLKALWENTHFAQATLREMGFDIGATETPIIPVYIRDYDKAFEFSQRLLAQGVFVNTVVPPAVNPEDALIRFSLMATHRRAQIEEALNKMHNIALDMAILPEAVIAR
jgi:8-amino-7-oxononanoate synthase